MKRVLIEVNESAHLVSYNGVCNRGLQHV